MNAIFRATLSIITVSLVTACVTHSDHDEASDIVGAASTSIDRAISRTPLSEPAVVRLERPPASIDHISGELDPEWFSTTYKTGATQPFGLLARNVFEGTGVVISFDADLDQHRTVSVIHDGTLRSILDEMSLASGYAYTIEGKRVFWHRLMTKTIRMEVLPGDISHQLGSLDQDEDQSDSGDVADTVILRSQDNYSETKTSLKVWEDISNVVVSIKSEEGKHFVSESAGTVTVTDYPSNVRKIVKALKEYDDLMAQQVMVKIDIINVVLEAGRSDAIDWKYIKETTSGSLEFLGPNSIPFTSFGDSPMSFKVANIGGSTNGSEVLLQALSSHRKTSLQIEPRLLAMHNQVTEYNVTTDTGYLASSQTIITDSIAETTLQGGLVTTGLTIHMLPHINREDSVVGFEIGLSISDLRSIEPKESGSAKIETPEVDKTVLKHRGRVRSGETMLVSGLKRSVAKSSGRENFDLSFAGSKVSDKEIVETLVLFTPIILE